MTQTKKISNVWYDDKKTMIFFGGDLVEFKGKRYICITRGMTQEFPNKNNSKFPKNIWREVSKEAYLNKKYKFIKMDEFYQ